MRGVGRGDEEVIKKIELKPKRGQEGDAEGEILRGFDR